MNERMKLIVSGAVAGFCFLAALFIPLAFRGGVQEIATSNIGERAELFSAYWGGDSSDIEVTSTGAPSKKTQDICDARITELVEACTFDKSESGTKSDGSEYLTVKRGELEIHVCRFWRQYQGDWRNWMDVCFDMDTGEIYYLYMSSECLKNKAEYVMSMPSGLDTAYVVDRIGNSDGFKLLDMKWSGDAGEAAEAIYSADGSALRLNVSCIYYESTLIDIKIVCA